MAEFRAFFVNLSKIPDEPLEAVFAHCVTVNAVSLHYGMEHLKHSKSGFWV